MSPIESPLPVESRVEALDHALPQTQCTRCGYDDCLRYAVAIDLGEAATNRCPPGGADGVLRLSSIAETPAHPLDPSCGVEAPRQLAVIDENWCIGCALCLDACPVDAIAGAAKRMHTVIDVHCTGCELCIPVCPVDCISLVGVTGDRTGWAAWTPAQALAAKQRYDRHRARLARPGNPTADVGVNGISLGGGDVDAGVPGPRLAAEDGTEEPAAARESRRPTSGDVADADRGRRRAAVAVALARARAQRAP